MSNEIVWQAKENAQPLDLSILLSCLTRSWLQLLGNVNNHVSAKRRAQVLSKIGPKYASLSNESWETNERELFGKQFEQRLKQRAETSKAISTASFVQRRKPFFPRGAPSKSSLWCSQLQDYSVFPKSVLSSFQAIQRKGRNNSTLHSCSQPLQTIEESSCWYRYVPRTFFNAHSFKTTYRGQNIWNTTKYNNIFISYIKHTNITPPASSKANRGRWYVDDWQSWQNISNCP